MAMVSMAFMACGNSTKTSEVENDSDTVAVDTVVVDSVDVDADVDSADVDVVICDVVDSVAAE